jgi:acetone carboxylase beta subunit
MTDAFIIDERGQFIVGKARTTPQDKSVGFMQSAVGALEQWDLRGCYEGWLGAPLP